MAFAVKQIQETSVHTERKRLVSVRLLVVSCGNRALATRVKRPLREQCAYVNRESDYCNLPAAPREDLFVHVLLYVL